MELQKKGLRDWLCHHSNAAVIWISLEIKHPFTKGNSNKGPEPVYPGAQP